MGHAGLAFHLHVLIGMALFTLWPFTRLVRPARGWAPVQPETRAPPKVTAPETPHLGDLAEYRWAGGFGSVHGIVVPESSTRSVTA